MRKTNSGTRIGTNDMVHVHPGDEIEHAGRNREVGIIATAREWLNIELGILVHITEFAFERKNRCQAVAESAPNPPAKIGVEIVCTLIVPIFTELCSPVERGIPEAFTFRDGLGCYGEIRW